MYSFLQKYILYKQLRKIILIFYTDQLKKDYECFSQGKSPHVCFGYNIK